MCWPGGRGPSVLAVPIGTIASPAEAAGHFRVPCPSGRCLSARAGSDAAIVAAIEAATAAVAAGEALALVTNPITKRTLDLAHLPYPGHTEFLAELADASRRSQQTPARDDAGGRGAQGRADHRAHPARRPCRGRSRALCSTTTVRITAAALAQDFGIAGPRIAVAGLNPHAGEGGLIGARGERRSSRRPSPSCVAEGIAVSGPHSADTLFHAEARRPTTRPSPCITIRR